MFRWQFLSICLLLSWAAEKSVNGDPVASRPVWYNGPISTSLVYQRPANSASGSESRAFPSPVFYASSHLTPPTTTAGPNSAEVKFTPTTTTETTPKVAKKYDIFKFFEKLKRVNEKYANRSPALGTQKQLNEDAEGVGEQNATDSDIVGDEEKYTESHSNDMAEAINEGMLIVAEMCDIKGELIWLMLLLHISLCLAPLSSSSSSSHARTN